MTTRAFIKTHAVAAYFALTFAISWSGFLMVAGPGGFANTSWQTDGRFPFAALAMLAGPSVTGHDRTDSLLVVTLMHASLTAGTIFIFTPLATGVSFLTYVWLLAAALWVVVAAVAATDGQGGTSRRGGTEVLPA